MEKLRNLTKEQLLVIGIMAGVLIGTITQNLGLWIPMGLVFGAALGQRKKRTPSEEKEDRE